MCPEGCFIHRSRYLAGVIYVLAMISWIRGSGNGWWCKWILAVIYGAGNIAGVYGEMVVGILLIDSTLALQSHAPYDMRPEREDFDYQIVTYHKKDWESHLNIDDNGPPELSFFDIGGLY